MSTDKVSKAFMGVKNVKASVAKTELVVFRVSKAEKDDMQATAKRLKMSLTELITRLYALAKPQLK